MRSRVASTVKYSLRHAGFDGEADHGLGIAGGAQIFARLAQPVLIEAPEIQLIAGGQAGGEAVAGGETMRAGAFPRWCRRDQR